ncbi:hypothetical protein SLA2020_494160 [Shorea laevis]
MNYWKAHGYLVSSSCGVVDHTVLEATQLPQLENQDSASVQEMIHELLEDPFDSLVSSSCEVTQPQLENQDISIQDRCKGILELWGAGEDEQYY